MKKSIIIALLVANILGVLSPFLSSATSRAYAQDHKMYIKLLSLMALLRSNKVKLTA